jgi:hypothetical protein
MEGWIFCSLRLRRVYNCLHIFKAYKVVHRASTGHPQVLHIGFCAGSNALFGGAKFIAAQSIVDKMCISDMFYYK